MIDVIFRRKSETMTWPVPGGWRTVPAFSRVRNELNGKRPDPTRLPDLETGITAGLNTGPVVMPRPFPLGAWQIYAVELSDNKWMKPVKIKTRATQHVQVWSLRNGQYDQPTGETFSDWGYWIHFCNGSHTTDGCIGMVSLDDMKDLAAMVKNALDSAIPIQVVAVDE
jgi:hypothetical protein